MTPQHAHVHELWLENRRGLEGLGIGEPSPRLSWIASTPADAWEVELQRDDGPIEHRLTPSGSTRLVEWPFAPLRSREGGHVRVRAVGADASWSPPLRVEAGLLDPADWVVRFASPSAAAPAGELRPGYLLRATWDNGDLGIVQGRIRRARVYSNAHGVYEHELNGSPVAADLLSPGWTSYRHRLRTQWVCSPTTTRKSTGGEKFASPTGSIASIATSRSSG